MDHGGGGGVIAELQANGDKLYNYCRIKIATFYYLLNLLSMRIQKDTNCKRAITERSNLTRNYLDRSIRSMNCSTLPRACVDLFALQCFCYRRNIRDNCKYTQRFLQKIIASEASVSSVCDAII